MITEKQLINLKELITENRQGEFYNWQAWRNTRAKVFEMDNRECQHCKARGRYKHGDIVHHVKHLTDRPDLALSIWDEDTGERQLVTICKSCHEAEHPDSIYHFARPAEPVSAERWD